MYTTLLVGADDSATALRAVGAAIDLAGALGAKLHIVTAYKPESVQMPDLPAEFHHASVTNPADALLNELGLLAKKAGVTVEHHAATGEPAEAIIRVAGRIGADLIVVGNKGMRGARRVLGSVPNSIAHHAPCSVLIVDTTHEQPRRTSSSASAPYLRGAFAPEDCPRSTLFHPGASGRETLMTLATSRIVRSLTLPRAEVASPSSDLERVSFELEGVLVSLLLDTFRLERNVAACCELLARQGSIGVAVRDGAVAPLAGGAHSEGAHSEGARRDLERTIERMERVCAAARSTISSGGRISDWLEAHPVP